MKRKQGYGARALALLAGLCMILTLLGGSALAVDLSKTCTVTVKPSGDEFLTDLAGVEITVDAYQVAGVTGYESADGYTFNQMAPFNLEIPANPDADTWEALAQSAAAIALSDEYTGDPKSADSDNGQIKLEDLGAGLYLLVAHEKGLEDYQATEKTDEGEELIVTVARSATYEYRFAPVLVAVPTKNDGNEDGVITTAADDGDWLYDAEVTLKPTRKDRFGELLIEKKLEGYGGDPVTFTFLVEAYMMNELDEEGNPRSVYSNAETITFYGPGAQTLAVNIPVGATVYVTEDPEPGPGYRLEAADAEPQVISAEKPAQVSFTNTFDETRRHGHSIVNSFEYQSEETGWEWTTIQDSGQ